MFVGMASRSILNNIFRIFSLKFFNVKKLILLIVFLVIVYHLLTLTHLGKRERFQISDALDLFPSGGETVDAAAAAPTDQKSDTISKVESPRLGVNGCQLIIKDYKQYTVKIDGVSYPQYLYLSQNKSINYDCLNNSTPLKKILAWNKFYGMYTLDQNDSIHFLT